MGTLGAAWVGVTVVAGAELVYHNMFGLAALASLFFTFSGIVAAKSDSDSKRRAWTLALNINRKTARLRSRPLRPLPRRRAGAL